MFFHALTPLSSSFHFEEFTTISPQKWTFSRNQAVSRTIFYCLLRNLTLIELFTIQKAFYSGDFEEVLSIDPETFTEANVVHAQVLVARAQVALGKFKELQSGLSGVTNSEVELSAVKWFAQYVQNAPGQRAKALREMEKLISANKENHTVEYLGGIVLVLEDRLDAALDLLLLHQGSLECISLIIHIRLLQNRLELAQKELLAAKKWAQDNIVFNISEAWVNFRQGGTDKYQDGYYIYEELASGGVVTFKALAGQIVSQLQLGRLPEASEALEEAFVLEPDNADLLINAISAAILSGRSYEELDTRLNKVAPSHAHLVDLRAKEDLFDRIASKYAEQAKS